MGMASVKHGNTHRRKSHEASHLHMASRGSRERRIGAIDGLRAIAIIGVVLYHMRPSLLPGGFLGVTVFFAISGFLATGSITRHRSLGKPFSYRSYIARRITRLAPPVLAIIALTALGTYAVAPSLLPKVQSDALPAALFVSNWSYIFRQVPYFAAAGLPSPLTHLWYLGVVMQFYLIWPPVLLAARSALKSRKRMLALTAGLILASTALMACLFNPTGDTARVYYGTDTRAAELLVGAFVALALPLAAKSRSQRLPRLRGALSTLVGLLCLVGLCAGFALARGDSAPLYRGGYLVAACAVGVLLAGAQRQEGLLNRALACAPLRYVSSRSFSLYLVHYPLLILMNPATRTTALADWEVALQLVAALAAAEAFYRLVEKPCVRLGKKRAELPARGVLAAVPVCCALVGACAVGALAAAPIDWQAIAQERAVALRPELVSRRAAAGSDAAQASAGSAEQAAAAHGSAGQGSAEAKVEPKKPKEPEKPKPVAEKVPKNLPYTSWTFNAKKGTCDAHVLIIGDSVTEGAKPALEKLLPNALVDGQVSRQLYVGQDVYAQDVASGYKPDAVIFALGLNGLIRDESTVQALVDAVDGKPLYFVTIRCPLELQDPNNKVLRKFADKYDNVGIIDWHGASEGHSEYLVDDGIHLTPDGADAFALLVRKALCGA